MTNILDGFKNLFEKKEAESAGVFPECFSIKTNLRILMLLALLNCDQKPVIINQADDTGEGTPTTADEQPDNSEIYTATVCLVGIKFDVTKKLIKFSNNNDEVVTVTVSDVDSGGTVAEKCLYAGDVFQQSAPALESGMMLNLHVELQGDDLACGLFVSEPCSDEKTIVLQPAE